MSINHDDLVTLMVRHYEIFIARATLFTGLLSCPELDSLVPPLGKKRRPESCRLSSSY